MISKNNNIKIETIIDHYDIGKVNKNTRNYSVKQTNSIPCKEMQNIFNDVTIYFLSEDISPENNNISLAEEFFENFYYLWKKIIKL